MRRPSHFAWVRLVPLLVLPLIFFLLPGGLPAGEAQSPEGQPIRLRTATFDPLQSGLGAADPALATATSLYLVQFGGPVRPEWTDAATRAGARLYGYLPENTFLARIAPDRLAAVQALPAVRWVGPYLPAFRVAPEAARVVAATAEPKRYIIQTLPDADRTALATAITSLGGSVESSVANAQAGYLRVRLLPARLTDVAALDGVVWVEPDHETVARNDEAAQIIGVERSDSGVDGVRQSLGLYGEGQTVAVVDSGLDTGITSTLHADFEGRVVASYCLGRPDPCDWSDLGGHGTHVAGSVLASGVISGANPSANQYAGAPAGMAPKANLVVQSIGADSGGLQPPEDNGDLFRDVYTDGVRISNNSWGDTLVRSGADANVGVYNAEAQQVDQAAWERKDFLPIFAVGNDGRDCLNNATQTSSDDSCTSPDGIVDLYSVGPPTTAKNMITVGATENNRAYITATWGSMYGDSFGADPVKSDKISDNPGGVGGFSSRGPLNDGRFAPTLVAPGIGILSARTGGFVFSDTVQSNPGPWTEVTAAGGAPGGDWEFRTDGGASGANYWRQTVNGTAAGTTPALTALLTAHQLNVKPAGGSLKIELRGRWRLTGDNQAHLVIQAPSTDANDPAGTYYTQTVDLEMTGTQTAWTYHTIPVEAKDLSDAKLDVSKLQIGFAIRSATNTFDSQLDIDDMRVVSGGFDFFLGNLGLATPGDAVDLSYAISNGTSMASPVTAGAAALAREWLTRTRGIDTPSAALLKAVLVNGTTDMSPGQYGSGEFREIPSQRPNNVTGFGRLNLIESLNPPSPRQIVLNDNATGVATGGTATYTYTVGAGAPLRVTLAWTDYPSQPAAARNLVNDLDLEVIGPDTTTYYGNDGAYPAGSEILNTARTNCLAGQADRCNTIESVVVTAPVTGTYRVIVRGTNVPQGKMGGSQPFALVAAGNNVQTATGGTPAPTVPGCLICEVATPTPAGSPSPTAELQRAYIPLSARTASAGW